MSTISHLTSPHVPRSPFPFSAPDFSCKRKCSYVQAHVLIKFLIRLRQRFWAAGSWRGKVRVWQQGGKLLHLAWQAHTSTVSTLAFSPAGARMGASWPVAALTRRPGSGTSMEPSGSGTCTVASISTHCGVTEPTSDSLSRATSQSHLNPRLTTHIHDFRITSIATTSTLPH